MNAVVDVRMADHLSGTCHGTVDMIEDILLTNLAKEAGLADYLQHLWSDTTQDNMDALLMALVDEDLQVVKTRSIDKRHLAHTDDAHHRRFLELGGQLLELVGNAEEEGTINLIDLDAIRDVQCLLVSNVDVAIVVDINLALLQ